MAEERNSESYVVDPNLWATMTEPERKKYLHELVMSRRNFTLDGVRYVYDSNLGPVS